MLEALSLEPSRAHINARTDPRWTYQRSLEMRRFLQTLRRPQNGMSRCPQDAETAIDLGMTQGLEGAGNAEVDGDLITRIFGHEAEEEGEEEENYSSEASSDSTSPGLASLIDSGSDDSEAEHEVLAETVFRQPPAEMPSPHIKREVL
eukprot:TRINITY_DN2504_c0_g1_i2.p1 TRINITY_DN2504_c0_g1~~TRINITY_DN2504_c0_g1_i2.p1  ORF type:complete len:148 (+),score=23.70 TRINITY_DN2504_c0_g1_i2:109-552(+)